ncbi:hypothetical protein WN51_13063 [Melipona quadrifasciata]|uniref:Uncharacterized protein n=1 Tax=Melipona quadrifasciata TaxID=166423 RepID=A0A0M9A2R4_9HYME|nr:hypothetical protein WN51_13063 [Melipona quadrifasciata]
MHASPHVIPTFVGVFTKNGIAITLLVIRQLMTTTDLTITTVTMRHLIQQKRFLSFFEMKILVPPI